MNSRKYRSVLRNIVVLIFASWASVAAQNEVQQGQPLDLPQFYFDALSFASDQPGKSRLDVYLEVPYEQLHFTNEGQLFTSSYEVTMSIHDSDNKLVDEKWWTEKIETKDYNESVSTKQSDLNQRSFILLPNHYVLTVQIHDEDTKKTFRQQRNITVKDFSTGMFAASDIMLVRKLTKEGNNKIVYPNISGNVSDVTEGFNIFFEAYDRSGADSVKINTSILDGKSNIVARDSCLQAIDTMRTACFCNITTADLVAGKYTISVEAAPYSSAQQEFTVHATTTRTFEVRWKGLPVTVVDLDLALEQMQYIVEKEELDKIRNIDIEKKRAQFIELWKQKDPTPGTERNELMEEYYSRIEYANKHFTHFYEGWKTDMGMVYIIFGPPGNIERHPFDIDAKPYEIWTYYNKNREFVFVDVSGFGDYRLQSPIWDVYRTRPR